ncbi:MAG: Glutamate-tRNA ligase [Candidatus Shapirobacteria bacterium GW2011_GWF1_38_23]|nr:MAG: Glutamate-tRNA ligase [Candidatus Shapirobacteria bacterium GW2011_GWF1_38_23]
MSDTNIVRTRMAPSPTGELHIGGLRTLLYDYALARQNHGQFILRLEDTDQKRHVEGAESRIFQVIKDYGLSWDEGPDIGGPYGPYVQTKRLNIYQKYIKELLDQDLAYYCFCSEQRLTEMREVQKAAHKVPKYDRHCLKLSSKEIKQKIENGEKYVIRLKMPDNENIVFKDLIRGEIKFNTNELDDQVLIKSDGIPTYHFAVVVDDHLMKITHIFRGEEWISSTPKQILLYKYFKWEVPNFAHLTVLLDPSGHGKMSKRHGSTHARAFLDDGYLPEAMLNFLMLLGWNPGTDKELFTLDEFIKEFNLEHLHKKSPIFDRKKLDYFNGLYIRQKSDEELFPYFKKFLPQASDEQIKILIPVLKERLIKFSDLSEQVKFLFEDVDYDKDLLLKKGTSSELAAEMLNKTKELLSDFTNLSSRILNECLPALGQEGTIRKLDLALTKLK